MFEKICIGTAQFGMNYGITNKSGIVCEEEVLSILNLAKRYGINSFDTAKGYGESEKVLGKYFLNNEKPFLINKLSLQFSNQRNDFEIDILEENFYKSLKDLNQKTIDCLLIHNPWELKKRDCTNLIKWINNLKRKGEIDKIGISIYEIKDLSGLNPFFFEAIQIPASLYNQSILKEHTISDILKNSFLIARSIYLQGLLLTPSENWPNWISEGSKKHHKNLEKFLFSRHLSFIDIALGYVNSLNEIDKFIVGICNRKELIELKNSLRHTNCFSKKDFSDWELKDNLLSDPRKWETYCN